MNTGTASFNTSSVQFLYYFQSFTSGLQHPFLLCSECCTGGKSVAVLLSNNSTII